MAYKKNPDDLLVRVNIQLTVKQIKYLDQLSAYGRSAVIRKFIDDDMSPSKIRSQGHDDIADEKPYWEHATPLDFELTYDAFANVLNKDLLESFNDGRDIAHIIPVFAKLLGKLVQKQAHPEQISVFLTEKMYECGGLSNTNFQKGT